MRMMRCDVVRCGAVRCTIEARRQAFLHAWESAAKWCLGREDDTVGNPHRANIYQFELFELILLLKLDKQFSIEQFEPTVSQSTVSSPLLISRSYKDQQKAPQDNESGAMGSKTPACILEP